MDAILMKQLLDWQKQVIYFHNSWSIIYFHISSSKNDSSWNSLHQSTIVDFSLPPTGTRCLHDLLLLLGDVLGSVGSKDGS
jgi:hypothetical protein